MSSINSTAAKHSRQSLADSHLITTAGALAILVSSSLVLATPFFLSAAGQSDKHHKDKDKAAADSQTLQGLPATDLTGDEAVVHALNRLGYGPRPGDIQRAKEMGLAKWIDLQLHPELLDDSALNPRLDRFPTLDMSSAQLEAKFPQARLAAKREGVSLQDYQKEQQAKQRAVLQAFGRRFRSANAGSCCRPNPRSNGKRRCLPRELAEQGCQ